MSILALFCISEEARQAVRRVMQLAADAADGTCLGLVQRRQSPASKDDIKKTIEHDETIITEFIGATVGECQAWLRDQQDRAKFIEQDILVVADVRTAQDGTVAFHTYIAPGEEEKFGGGYDVLPRPDDGVDGWYSFRIPPQGAFRLWADFSLGEFDVAWPIYFGHRKRITKEDGVLDMDLVARLARGEEPKVFDFSNHGGDEDGGEEER